MSKRSEARKQRLLPDGKPRYVRCYDNGGETADRYTVVFTGHYTHLTLRQHLFIGMSAHPYAPYGICQHGESDTQIDYPSYKHLGKRIQFDALPTDCQTVVLADYVYLWDIKDHPLYSEN